MCAPHQVRRLRGPRVELKAATGWFAPCGECDADGSNPERASRLSVGLRTMTVPLLPSPEARDGFWERPGSWRIPATCRRLRLP
jgi:hypothetical protein